MPMWRCPHCGTPQAETARCWVCRRSSTACGTCRHFRHSVAADLGYCGLDRRRAPLAGDEIRACWEAGQTVPAVEPLRPAVTVAPAPMPAGSTRAAVVATVDGGKAPRDFVEVGSGRPIRQAAPPSRRPTDAEAATPVALPPPVEPGWSLWGDPDA